MQLQLPMLFLDKLEPFEINLVRSSKPSAKNVCLR